MKYSGLSKCSLVASNMALAATFCVGMHPTITLVACILMLLGVGFWLVQGRYRLGYHYGLSLLVVAAAQYYYHLWIGLSITSASIAVVFVILQTIEYLFKKERLIKDC